MGGWPYLAVLAAVTVVGVWSSDRAEVVFRKMDDGRIVIDEVAGQLITLLPLLLLPAASGASGVATAGSFQSDEFIWLVVTGFVVFRLLDIYKPGLIRSAERHIAGGAGVMADDCAAGLVGALILAVPTIFVL
ncbi:MAG: phosphatidylglycerophosphatase A [Myxococcota bacterium]|jgi:phosphatidylglycerophosphatase A